MFTGHGLAALRALAALLAVGLLLALLAAACGGGGGETKQAGETPTGETAEAGETPAADEGEGGEGAGDQGLQELETLAGEAAQGVTAKVTYKYTSDVAGEVTEGEWVLVQRPPDSRFEISTTEGGQEFRTIIINAGGKSYLCTSGGGQESCLATSTEETQAEAAPFDPLFDIPSEIAEEAADVDLVDKSQRQIAGVDANCFTVRSTLIDLGEGEMCFSDDGLLLFLRSQTDSESFTFEATEVSTDVTDADFEPPYEIVELPGLDELPDFEIPTP